MGSFSRESEGRGKGYTRVVRPRYGEYFHWSTASSFTGTMSRRVKWFRKLRGMV